MTRFKISTIFIFRKDSISSFSYWKTFIKLNAKLTCVDERPAYKNNYNLSGF